MWGGSPGGLSKGADAADKSRSWHHRRGSNPGAGRHKGVDQAGPPPTLRPLKQAGPAAQGPGPAWSSYWQPLGCCAACPPRSPTIAGCSMPHLLEEPAWRVGARCTSWSSGSRAETEVAGGRKLKCARRADQDNHSSGLGGCKGGVCRKNGKPGVSQPRKAESKSSDHDTPLPHNCRRRVKGR